MKTRKIRPHPLIAAAWLSLLISTDATAQEHRGFVYGSIGRASIGHADSEQGKAPIFGGGVAYRVAPRLVIEGDVHGARIENVFGRERHVFTMATLTGSILYRQPLDEKVDFVAGGGLGYQRAHVDFTLDPFGRIDRTESTRLLHGKTGVQWQATNRVALRVEGVLWMGSGLDWVFGGRVGLGYTF